MLKMNSRRVLLVDDKPQQLFALYTMLKRRSFKVATAHNAREGLRRLENEPTDIVVTELRMKGTDGLQFADAIRKRLGKEELPIVFLATNANEPQLAALNNWQAGTAVISAKDAQNGALVDLLNQLLLQNQDQDEPTAADLVATTALNASYLSVEFQSAGA